MIPLAVNDDRIVLLADLGALLPHLLDKRARGVVTHRVDPAPAQDLLNLDARAKCRNDDDVFFAQLVERNKLLAGGRSQEPDALLLQVVVEIGRASCREGAK